MKEQIQRLGNTPSVETQQGKLASTVTQASATPVIAPAPSSGQRLAQALNVGVTGATAVYGKVVEDENIKEAAYQTIEGSAAGIRYAQDVITKARELPLDQQSTYIRGKMEIGLNEIKGKNVSKSYLSAYMNSFANNTNEFDAKANETLYLHKKEEDKLKTASMIVQQRIAPLGDITDKDGKVIGKQTKEDQHEAILNSIMAANDMDRAKAGELYVESMGGYIKQQAENNPNYDWQAAISNELKILSKDKAVNYATHPTYGKLIDTLESHLTTLTTARAAAYEKQKTKEAVQNTNGYLSVLYDDNVSPETITKVKSEMFNNYKDYTVEQYKTINTAIEDARNEKGFATVSNPQFFNNMLSKATLGKIGLDGLPSYKAYLTKAEYNQVASAMIKHNGESIDTIKTTHKQSLTDLESSAVAILTQMDPVSKLVSPDSAKKINRFKIINNAWLTKYTRDNGELPSFEEALQMQDKILKHVQGDKTGTISGIAPIGGGQQTQQPKKQQPSTNTKRPVINAEWAKKAPREEVALALKNKWVTQEQLRAWKAGK